MNNLFKFTKHSLFIISCLFWMVISCRQNEQKKSTIEPVLFAENIAPIIFKNCSKCHLDGEAAPFSLLTYNDIAPKAKLIEYVISHKIMPPWPADADYTHFANETVLSGEEIELIRKWITDGLLPGDTAHLKSNEQIKKVLNLGKPDLIVKSPQPFKVSGNNQDLFLVVKMPYEIPKDTFVRAIEFVPGNKRLVHHMNAHLLQYDPTKKSNLFDGKYWVNQNQSNSQLVHKELNLMQDDDTYPPMTPSVCNYLPGAQFSFYPKEIGGYPISRKGAFYLNDLHFGPTPFDALDSSYFKVYYNATPPKRPVSEFQIGTLGITPVEPTLIIPANEKKTFHIKFNVPQDISVISIIPHMHLIGKTYWAYAIKPGGDTIRLIRIPQWDFRWQYFYQPKTLLKIPMGSTIYVEGTYDNTTANPENPFNPPRLIRERNGSMRTTDEMFQLIITYVPYKKGDEAISLENIEP
ncbi:MAG: cytochrome c [Bacteroidia bacterium]|nr:cytochrome c [Bacteroidia bacterium]